MIMYLFDIVTSYLYWKITFVSLYVTIFLSFLYVLSICSSKLLLISAWILCALFCFAEIFFILGWCISDNICNSSIYSTKPEQT